VLRRQISCDAGSERLRADMLVQLVACKCPAAVAPGLKWERRVCIPLAMPRLSVPHSSLDACNELPAPMPPSSFDRGPLIVIDVRLVECGVVSAWLLSLQLEMVPMPRSCHPGGIPRGNSGDSVAGTLARSGQAVPLLRVLSRSPGLHPSADASVWVTAWDANNSHYSLLVLRVF